MVKRWAAWACFLAASVTASAAPSPPGGAAAPLGRIERSPEFVTRVNDAIGRGVAWLKKSQTNDGSFREFPEFPGATTALAYVTMRVCSVGRDEAAATAAWTSLKHDYRRTDIRTYSAAVYLMAIAEHGERVPGGTNDHDVKLAKDETKWAEELVRCLVGSQNDDGCWNYMTEGAQIGQAGEQLPSQYDHSNTQYALLGLKSAARCGIAIDPAVWKKSLLHFLAEQEPAGPEVTRGTGPVQKGGTSAPVTDHARAWTYQAPSKAARGADASRPVSIAMTAGGISSVVICRSELIGTREMTAKLDTDSEHAAWDGLAWIGTNWVPTALLKPGDDMVPKFREAMGTGLSLYEFYGVERAGVLAGVDWMATRDWYGEGADSLLATQLADGSWTGLDAGLMTGNLAERKSAYHPVDTCFALLFLRRGTLPVRRGAVTQSDGDADINFGAAVHLAGKDLEDFLDLVFARWRRATDDAVKRRLFDGASAAGPKIVEPLLVRLDAPDPAKRTAAHALLKYATDQDFGYDPDGAAAARDAAVVKWQMWWMGAKDRIAYDAATKRLVTR